MALLLTKHNNLRVKANAWITYGTTKRTWFKGCLTYTAPTRTGANSKRGASTARREESNSKKCDIFATLYQNYKWRFDPLVLFFIKILRKQAVDGRNYGKTLIYISKQSTKRSTTIFFHGRLLQFLAVFMHFARTHIFLNFIYCGRPNPY